MFKLYVNLEIEDMNLKNQLKYIKENQNKLKKKVKEQKNVLI